MKQAIEVAKRHRALIWAIVVAIVLAALLMFSTKKLAAEQARLGDRETILCASGAYGDRVEDRCEFNEEAKRLVHSHGRSRLVLERLGTDFG